MWQQIAPGFKMMLVLTVLTGLIYPGVVTGLCQILFPAQANGSLIVSEWAGCGFGTHRTEFQEARVLPTAAFRGRQRRIRSHRFRCVESWPDKPEAGRTA